MFVLQVLLLIIITFIGFVSIVRLWLKDTYFELKVNISLFKKTCDLVRKTINNYKQIQEEPSSDLLIDSGERLRRSRENMRTVFFNGNCILSRILNKLPIETIHRFIDDYNLLKYGIFSKEELLKELEINKPQASVALITLWQLTLEADNNYLELREHEGIVNKNEIEKIASELQKIYLEKGNE